MKKSWGSLKRRLAVIWLTGFGIGFFILLIQTFSGMYGANVSRAWEWFLPNVLPSLSLIVGALTMETGNTQTPVSNERKFAFRVCTILSIAYILTVLSVIFLQPFSSFYPLDLMRQSNLWLAPFQGLVTASIGVMFLKGGGKHGDA